MNPVSEQQYYSLRYKKSGWHKFTPQEVNLLEVFLFEGK